MKKVYILFTLIAGFCLIKGQESTIKATITVINKTNKTLKIKNNDLIQLNLKANEQGKFQEELTPMSSTGSDSTLTYMFNKKIGVEEENGTRLFSLFTRINRNNNETTTIFAQLTPVSNAPFVIMGNANQAFLLNQPYLPTNIKEINLTATIEANYARSTLTMAIDQTAK